MELRRYLKALQRWAWLLVLCPVLAAIVAAGVSSRLAPVYESSVSVLVRPAQPLTVDTGVVSLTSDQISHTYAQLMIQRPLMVQVIQDLGLKTTPATLQAQVTVAPEPNTTILDVSVRSTNPALARDIANTVVGDFIDEIKQIQTQERTNLNARAQDNLVVVSPAVLPTQPVSPNIPRNAELAFALALLAATGVIVLLEYLDQSVRNDETLTERTGMVAIGHVMFSAAPRTRRAELVVLDPQSSFAEAYRALRTNLMFADVDHAIRTVVITSAQPGEGKSRTAANLAAALAQAGHKVLLIDADFRRPSLHRILGQVRNLGLSNLMINEGTEEGLAIALQGIPNLWFMPSGPTPPNPSELLGSGRMRTLLASFRERYHYVIIDTPPVNAVTDATVVAAGADATILVVEHARTSYRSATHARASLERVGAKVIGAIVNKIRAQHDGYYDDYRYGYYGEEAPANGRSSRQSRTTATSPQERVSAAPAVSSELTHDPESKRIS